MNKKDNFFRRRYRRLSAVKIAISCLQNFLKSEEDLYNRRSVLVFSALSALLNSLLIVIDEELDTTRERLSEIDNA